MKSEMTVSLHAASTQSVLLAAGRPAPVVTSQVGSKLVRYDATCFASATVCFAIAWNAATVSVAYAEVGSEIFSN